MDDAELEATLAEALDGGTVSLSRAGGAWRIHARLSGVVVDHDADLGALLRRALGRRADARATRRMSGDD